MTSLIYELGGYLDQCTWTQVALLSINSGCQLWMQCFAYMRCLDMVAVPQSTLLDMALGQLLAHLPTCCHFVVTAAAANGTHHAGFDKNSPGEHGR